MCVCVCLAVSTCAICFSLMRTSPHVVYTRAVYYCVIVCTLCIMFSPVGSAEKLFNLCDEYADSTKKKVHIWPLQNAALILCPVSAPDDGKCPNYNQTSPLLTRQHACTYIVESHSVLETHSVLKAHSVSPNYLRARAWILITSHIFLSWSIIVRMMHTLI